MTQESLQLPEKTQAEPVQLSPAVTFQWVHGGKAFAVTITSTTQKEVDIYTEANIAALQMWSKDQRFFSLQDVSHPDVTMTPYFRKRLDDVTGEIKKSGLAGDSVILLSNSIMGRIVQIYGRIFARRAEPITQHWFTNYDKGFEALTNLVEK